MAATFFISDLHLAPDRPLVTQAFRRFLSTTAIEAQTLYILGDLFDTWVGDDDDTPEYQAIADAIHHYQQDGRQVFFMHGNRDFLLGAAFATAAGMKLIEDDATVIQLVQGTCLLMHGDSLCTKDTDYMKLRRVLRNPEWQAATLAKSLTERKALASEMRAKSQTMTSIKAEDIMDVTHEEVDRVMSSQRTQLLIHGHTHRPGRHLLTINHQPAERIVLGDWHNLGWYLVSNHQGLQLCSFPIATSAE